ncbi:galactose oxidase [Apiospora kogelbergensis]|uniref:Galactose oxidase n=1 Tax=Apiospora kogelbergensis TaxID=1337665 RepID=A0AAW0R1M9_9PEZI
MAEIAAAALATEQVVSTAAQATAAYTVARPTNGLKAAFSQIATAGADGTRASLVRSHHSLTVVDKRAYIFGGRTSSNNKLADNEMHSLALPTQDPADKSDYRLIPALSVLERDESVPAARSDHSACASNGRVAIFAGADEAGALIQDATIWLFDVETSVWHALRAELSASVPPPPAQGGQAGNDFVVYGGKDEGDVPLEDVWRFDYASKTWTRLPDAPAVTSNAAFADHTLYLIAGNDDLSSSLHYLDLGQSSTAAEGPSAAAWETVVFPTNPLAPGPRPRENGGLLHVSTGYGRNYLLYFFGERSTSSLAPTDDSASSKPTQWSDMWTLQLPSSDVANKATTTLSDAVKPAKIKDAIRAAFGASGKHTWAEVEVKPPGDVAGHSGKLHPGPRGFFGYDVIEKGSSVVLWGGVDAKGETEGDGWIIQLE